MAQEMSPHNQLLQRLGSTFVGQLRRSLIPIEHALIKEKIEGKGTFACTVTFERREDAMTAKVTFKSSSPIAEHELTLVIDDAEQLAMPFRRAAIEQPDERPPGPAEQGEAPSFQ